MRKRFWHISKPDGCGSHGDQANFFQKACEMEGVEYIRITDKDFNAIDYLDLDLGKNDLVYRSARGNWAKSLEKLLVDNNTKHIFNNPKTVLTGKGSSYDLLKSRGLPVIPSIPFLPTKKKLAREYVEYLGGFPVVIKVSGGMEGVGVIRVDSQESLNSVVDFLKKDDSHHNRLMQYIPHDYYARVVVVNDDVVAATYDTAPEGDFRTNSRGPRVKKISSFEPSKEVSELCIEAVKSINVKAGGVDVLYGKDGNVYLAEVNSPFNFGETQKVTEIDIAHRILKAILS